MISGGGPGAAGGDMLDTLCYKNTYECEKISLAINIFFTVSFVVSGVDGVIFDEVSRLIYGSIVCGYAFGAAPTFFQMAFNAGDLTSVTFGLMQGSLCLLTRVLNIYWTILILRKILRPSKPKKKSS
ncbi:unnamed protein product [Adineta steineri]|uniref:Uncharacterized protein n=1 Tax=Adineta steineri TaxID=433720 RepID=A0A815FVI7_9BILA|nr:unnamed protein product [Adineta steineri]